MSSNDDKNQDMAMLIFLELFNSLDLNNDDKYNLSHSGIVEKPLNKINSEVNAHLIKMVELVDCFLNITYDEEQNKVAYELSTTPIENKIISFEEHKLIKNREQ